MTSVQQKAGALADRIIAAGEASSDKLGVVGLPVAIVAGAVTVPAGAVIGGVGQGLAKAGKGVLDAYRPTATPSRWSMDQNKTIMTAGVLGVATTVVAGSAALAGIGELTLAGAGALGVFAAGAGFVGSGVVNGVAQGVIGLGKGGLKGAEAGLGAAKVAGGASQVFAEDAAKAVVKAVKNIGHVVEVSAHNTVEAGREAVEDVRALEVKTAKAVLDVAVERANRVSNGGDRFDKQGNEIKDTPPEFKKF